MRQNSKDSFPESRQKAVGRRQGIIFLLTAYCLLLTGLTGCSEAIQKKFVRKPKTPVGRPQPVVAFRNYMEGMTPLDRYRKHYALFAYWNDQLVSELEDRNMNFKRAQRASQETLRELKELSVLLNDEAAAELHPMIEERVGVDAQLRGSMTGTIHMRNAARTLDMQTRRLTRRFDWRQVDDRLKPAADARAD